MVGYADIHSQCFRDTVSAYQKVRQDGELHIPAFMAALEGYKNMRAKLKTQADKYKGTSPLLRLSTPRSTGRVFAINGG